MPKRPAKKKEETTVSPEQLEMSEVSKEIQVVLESKGYALQPFMQFSEYGVVPRVRLVKVPKDKTNDTNQAADSAEAGEPQG